jgi:conflict system STAND superfamily ATPase
MNRAKMSREPAPRSSPFKCLDYYEEKDEARFAGREREIAEISDAIAYERTLVLYGKSGLGKTSLLLAGVFPELRRRELVPVHLRTLADPLADVCREVARQVKNEPAGPRDARPFTREEALELLRACSAKAPLVLVLDQFEEFFLRFRDQPTIYSEFIETVAAVVREPGLAVHVLFSLREEYIADLDDFRAHLPALFENEYRLRPLTAFGVREAITKALEAADIPYETSIVSRLVDEVAAKQFDSVVLQILCQEVFENAVKRSRGQVRLSTADLQSPEIDSVLHRYLDEMAGDLSASEHLNARMLMRVMITRQHTKQAMRASDFNGDFFRLEEPTVLDLLRIMKSHRLIRADERGGERWHELSHERLTPILEGWLRLDPDYNSLIAAHDWIVTQCRVGAWRAAPMHLLPRGYLAKVVRPFSKRLVLDREQLEFILMSAAYHKATADFHLWADRYGVDEAIVWLGDALSSPDASVRAGAVFIIGKMAGQAILPSARVEQLAFNDPLPFVRMQAVLSLVEMGKVGGALRALPAAYLFWVFKIVRSGPDLDVERLLGSVYDRVIDRASEGSEARRIGRSATLDEPEPAKDPAA